ncbi:hypothetical protein EZV62_004239 [Acer yangbiense]|uniref:Uncharacterized protein n=1 Tax=Acer yangbiense TaxID=1000413 RepID=A0A5C7IK98_9ROSI|nr:hypothetical protein EZV62_004239 [Acer yangbiense]
MKKISGVPPPFYSSTISEEKAENTRFRGRNDNIRAVRSQVTEKKSPEEVASNINIKLESQPSMDINESADAFIKKFRQQLLIQRLESIENYEQMLARGRVKDHFSVECDDYGVSFIEAHIATNISEALQNPHPLLLEQLMPYKPHELITTTQFNLAVQVSYFGCGGVAICVCFRHCIADGATAANFIKSWSAVASCGDNNIDAIEKDVVFDFSSIFPPEDWSGLSTNISSQELIKSSSTDTVVKRFVFDGSKMAALREIIGNRPTRFEAVFALMWKAVTSAKIEEIASTNLMCAVHTWDMQEDGDRGSGY